MTRRPDPQVTLEQLLLALRRSGGIRLPLGLGAAGYGLMRAAGYRPKRARSINYMARRVARDWRKNRHDPTDEELADTARRLLL